MHQETHGESARTQIQPAKKHGILPTNYGDSTNRGNPEARHSQENMSLGTSITLARSQPPQLTHSTHVSIIIYIHMITDIKLTLYIDNKHIYVKIM